MENIKQKYPKSLRGRQCIGPCYPSDIVAIHPTTLEKIDTISEKITKPYCPVDEYENEEGEKKLYDFCYPPTFDKTDTTDITGDIVTPLFSFDNNNFLKLYYKIHSFDDALDWITSQQKSYLTKIRIIDCALLVHGPNFEITSDRLVNFYLNIFATKLITDFYNKLGKYIHIKENEAYIGKPNNNNNHKVEKEQYIIKKFLQHDMFDKFILIYMENHHSDWNEIDSHSDLIKNEYIQYIESKILLTLKQK